MIELMNFHPDKCETLKIKKVKPINYDHKRSLAIDYIPKSKQDKLNKGRPIWQSWRTATQVTTLQNTYLRLSLRRKDQQQTVLEPPRRCYHKESK